MGLNDKVWPDLDQAEGQTEEEVCAIERSYPKVGVGQILSGILNTSAVTYTFQNLNAEFKMGVNVNWPWPI